MPRSYRIFFHEGEEFPALIQVPGGRAWLDGEALEIDSKHRKLRIPIADLREAEMYSRAASMHVIRVRYAGGCVHLAVIRFMIGGALALVNVLGTRSLFRELEAAIAGNRNTRI